MQPIAMAFFGAVIFAVIKIIEFAVVWYREQEEEEFDKKWKEMIEEADAICYERMHNTIGHKVDNAMHRYNRNIDR